jgi:hypothetical protein
MKKRINVFFALLLLVVVGRAQQITPVNIGTGPNSRNGDPLRTAFSKLNDNDALLWDTTTTISVRLDSLITAGVGGGVNWGDVNGTLSNQADLQSALDLKVDVVPVTATGTAIAFDVPRTYGYLIVETGNITLNSTGLKEGITQLIIHNHSTEPTFGAEFKIIGGAYATGQDNYILLHAVKSSLVLVTISQEL